MNHICNYIMKATMMIALLVSGTAGANNTPDWTVDAEDYEYSMQVSAQVEGPGGELIDEDGSLLGILKNGEVRGVGELVDGPDDSLLFMPLVFSNETSGETLEFKVYDAGADEILPIVETLDFEADENFGVVDQPEILNVQVPTYTLTYEAGEGGSIDGETVQEVQHGEDGQPVTAEADAGYEFIQWDDGVPEADRIDTNVTEDISVVAVFAEEGEWTLDILEPVGEGTTDPETGEHTYAVGENPTVSAEPEEGWMLDQWLLGGADAGSELDINVSSGVDGETIEIQAVFVPELQYRINRAAEGDVIVVEQGIYTAAEPLHINVDGLTLRSVDGRDVTDIVADGGDKAIIIEAENVSIEGLAIWDYTVTGIEVRGSTAAISSNTIQGENGTTGILIRGGADNTFISNNTLSNNETGIRNESLAGVYPWDNRAIYNNIVGNVAGAEWDADGIDDQWLEATFNWWGHEDGPDHDEGDPVVGDVRFTPWIENASEGIGRGSLAGGGDDIDDVRDVRGGVAARTNRGSVFATARQRGNLPQRQPIEAYYELVVMDDDGGEMTEITFEIAYNEPIDGSLYWYDENPDIQDWIECPEDILNWNPGPNPYAEDGYDGFVQVTVDDNPATRPYLGDFSSVVFSTGGEDDGFRDVSGSGGCFIATAAFGAADSPAVNALRQFRDQYMLTNSPGRAMTQLYYRVSPPIAEAIVGNPLLRTMTALALLPIIAIAFLSVNNILIAALLAAGMAALAFSIGKRMKNSSITFLSLIVIAALFAGSPNVRGADINHFEPAPGESKTVVIPTTETVGERAVSGYLFYSYAGTLLEGRGADDGRLKLAEKQHLSILGAAYGVSDSLQLNLSLPILFTQDTDMDDIVDTRGLGDITLGTKYRFPMEIEDTRFALAPHLKLHTGREDALIGSDRLSSGLRLIADRPLHDNILASVNLGYEYQSRRPLGQVNINHSLLYGAGLMFELPGTRFSFSGELFGRSERLDRSSHSPAEALLSTVYNLNDVQLTGGLTIGFNDGYGTADWRLFKGLKFGF